MGGEKVNEANYVSLEASKRLDEAGIVLVTEKAWIMSYTGWELVDNIKYYGFWKDAKKYPAPSMAEVWRELPLGSRLMRGTEDRAVAWRWDSGEMINTNPTDALIDLLIWLRKEKP